MALVRRTALARGGALSRRTPLKPVSNRRKAAERQRAKYVSKQLAERPWCEVRWEGCTGRSEHLHEPETRARFFGSAYRFDPSKDVASCLHCHDQIHHHQPARAEAEGYLVPSWS